LGKFLDNSSSFDRNIVLIAPAICHINILLATAHGEPGDPAITNLRADLGQLHFADRKLDQFPRAVTQIQTVRNHRGVMFLHHDPNLRLIAVHETFKFHKILRGTVLVLVDSIPGRNHLLVNNHSRVHGPLLVRNLAKVQSCIIKGGPFGQIRLISFCSTQ
jgi:hypothetical protein